MPVPPMDNELIDKLSAEEIIKLLDEQLGSMLRHESGLKVNIPERDIEVSDYVFQLVRQAYQNVGWKNVEYSTEWVGTRNDGETMHVFTFYRE